MYLYLCVKYFVLTIKYNLKWFKRSAIKQFFIYFEKQKTRGYFLKIYLFLKLISCKRVVQGANKRVLIVENICGCHLLF